MINSIGDIEQLATQYFGPDANQRQYAAGHLDAICKGGDQSEGPLISIFCESSNQYALFYAAQAIVQWTKTNGPHLTPERRQGVVQRVGDALRRVALTAAGAAAATGGSSPTPAQSPQQPNSSAAVFGGASTVAVMKSLITSYARLMKLGYEKEPYLPDAAQSAVQLVTMASNDAEYRLGLMLLEGMLTEFSNHDSSKAHSFMSFTVHRRCSNNFRDVSLREIFETALHALKRLHQQSQQQESNGQGALLSVHHPHIAETVSVVQKCLSYDFMAILVDETEDAMSSQFPAAWRDLLLTDDTNYLLWKSLDFLPVPHCTLLMRGLSALCGVRRTFFETTEDRLQYLNRLFTLFLESFMNRQDHRMTSPQFLHEVAESCLRFVAPFGYRDLHLSNVFFPWLTAIKDLTLDVLARPCDGSGASAASPNGSARANGLLVDDGHGDFSAPATTFMNFWGRLTSSLRMYASARDENEVGSAQLMQEFVMEVAMRFFQTRIALNGPPLTEDTKMLTDAIVTQCENCTLLCLLSPAMMLSRLADYLVHQVTASALCGTSPSGVMWLFYMAGCLVRTVLSNVEEGAVSAEAYFFRFCVECVYTRQSMFQQVGDPRCADDVTSLFGTTVELAQLHFFTYVQLILCCERIHVALQTAVTEIFQSPQNLFQFLLTHTGHNIMRQVDGTQDENVVAVMKASIDLIAEACSQMQSSGLAQQVRFDLPPVVELPLSLSIKTYRLRTNLYHMMWPLRMPQRYAIGEFYNFLSPIDHCLQQTLSGNGNNPSYIAGWLRDLRGVARAVLDRPEAKGDFAAWFCDRAPSLHSILSGPAGDSPLVVISFLRFCSDLITSKHGQNLMDRSSHSANGLLLFKLICGFIQQIVQRCITDEKIQVVVSGGPIDGAYEMMLKPLSLSMGLLRACVSENFVPFGAMWFYNDETYDNTLLGLLRMLSVFPSSIFREYAKVSNEILRLLRGIAEEQTYHPLIKLSTQELETILFFVIERCEDVDIQTGPLLHGMSFLVFIAELIRDVKELSQKNQEQASAGISPTLGAVGGAGATPPRSPAPSAYHLDGTTLSSGTPGSSGRHSRTGAARSLRIVREGLARLLEPMQGLWSSLIRVAMNIIVSQDRAISVSCGVVYPIFEAYPPFWYEFLEHFVQSYPMAKQGTVRDALSILSNGASSSETFFSEVFSFRQKMREL